MPDKDLIGWAKEFGSQVEVLENIDEAVENADLVVTDTHLSMHNEKSKANDRFKILQRYQVNKELMKKAKPDAIFMHCLPAHRNVEVTGDVIDGPQSAVFDAVSNRLHVQKAIMKWCMSRTDL